MTDTLRHFRDRAAATLIPFFLGAAHGDARKARTAACAAIDCYDTRTPGEIQLSAQIVACQLASIACLRAAIAGQLPVEDVLKLQQAALSLDRLVHRSRKALRARPRERETAPDQLRGENSNWNDEAFQQVITKALQHMCDADAQIRDLLAACGLKPTVPAKRPKLEVITGEPMTPAMLSRLAADARKEETARRH
jgi:hypothetical protein